MVIVRRAHALLVVDLYGPFAPLFFVFHDIISINSV